MEANCIFCKIVAGQSKADVVYRDEQVTAFRDAHPAAPVHVLIVPNQHIDGIDRITPEDERLIGQLFTAANEVAKLEGVDQSGYRLIINNGRDSGQAVFHLHLHVLGGKRMRLQVD